MVIHLLHTSVGLGYCYCKFLYYQNFVIYYTLPRNYKSW